MDSATNKATKSCLLKTYLYLFLGLIIICLAIIAFYKLKVPVANNIWLFLGLAAFIIIMIFLLSSMKQGVGKVLVAILVLILLSYFFYPLVVSLTFEELLKYIGITLVLFVMLSIIAYMLPPTFFLSWGNILFILLIILIVLGLLGIFLFRQSRAFNLFYFLAVIALFGAFILFDTQKTIVSCQQTLGQIDYINASFSFVISIMNLFAGVAGVGQLA